MRSTLLVVCGLQAEAKIFRQVDVDARLDLDVLVGGGDQTRLAADLKRSASGARAILSFGVAGGLSPDLRAGHVCVGDGVVLPSGERLSTDPAWTNAIARRLSAPIGLIAGADMPLADMAGKAALRSRTGADVIDMETHIVAQAAQAHGLPFAALRVVTDAADRALPHAATVGMRADGKVDLVAILVSLGRNPAQLANLIRTGFEARTAFAVLLRCRQGLGPGFAFLDLGEPLLDMA